MESTSGGNASDSGSEKGSLASDLLSTDGGNWPLFVQFSVSVHANGHMETFSVDSIPNCLNDILKRCSGSGLVFGQEQGSYPPSHRTLLTLYFVYPN